MSKKITTSGDKDVLVELVKASVTEAQLNTLRENGIVDDEGHVVFAKSSWGLKKADSVENGYLGTITMDCGKLQWPIAISKTRAGRIFARYSVYTGKKEGEDGTLEDRKPFYPPWKDRDMIPAFRELMKNFGEYLTLKGEV